MTANMIFPPGNWNETVNVNDTIVLDYTSTYPGMNLTLWCETVEGTGDWIWWYLPGPLPSKGTYNLHLADFDFTDSVNVFPTRCHFDLVNSNNKTQDVNGGNIPLSTHNGVAAVTWSASGTGASGSATSAASTLPKPTAHSSGTSSQLSTATNGQASGPTSTSGADNSSSGLSSSAKVGVGVGVGLGAALLITLAIIAILLYRRRRQRDLRAGYPSAMAAPPSLTPGRDRFEKAELLGDQAVVRNELPGDGGIGAYTQREHLRPGDFADQSHSSTQDTSSEVSGGALLYQSQGRHSQPSQRYELGG